MANSNNLSPVESLSKVIQEDLVKLRYTDYPMLNALTKLSTPRQSINWNVNVSTDFTGGGSLTTDDAKAASSDTVVPATLPIGAYAYRETVQLPEIDIAQNASIGVGELKNLIQAQSRFQVDRMLRKMNKSLFVGAGAQANAGIYGLDTVVAQTGIYANIDQANYAEWKGAFVNDNAGTARALTSKVFYDADVACHRSGVGSYNLIVTSPEIVAEYIQLFSNERVLNQAGVNSTADVGFSNVDYRGIPLVIDRDCEPGTIYFVNTNYISLYTFALQSRANRSTLSSNGLTFNVGVRPLDNMYSTSFELGIIPQLQIMDRRAIGVVKDIAV